MFIEFGDHMAITCGIYRAEHGALNMSDLDVILDIAPTLSDLSQIA